MGADVACFKLYPATKADFKAWLEHEDLTADEGLRFLLKRVGWRDSKKPVVEETECQT